MPAVPGLLEYRKDNKKLYVRSNETWNVIGEEKKVILMLLCLPSILLQLYINAVTIVVEKNSNY